jgi:hypothetical protein
MSSSDKEKLSFHDDTSIDCAICLEPLLDDNNNGNIGNGNYDGDDDGGAVIKLACGHVYHFDCLVQQLQTAQPKANGRRLLFRGCQCALCGKICDDHPRLTGKIVRSTDRLRKEVDQLLKEQLKEELPDIYRLAQEQGSDAMALLLEEGRRKYAFYLCAHCDKPYFGGTVECAEDMLHDIDQQAKGNSSIDERLCPGCAPQTQIICHDPVDHGRYLIWKCRYCCQPASHLCYGNVHFCDDCHTRNSARVREANVNGRSLGARPPPLQPQSCPGGDRCNFPKPRGITVNDSNGPVFHKNGSTIECEQVYFCALCDSSGRRHWSWQHDNLNLRPGSANLIRNPSGAEGLAGWQHYSRRSRASMWEVEQSELPVNADTITNFVSSFQPCIMSQTIDLDDIMNVTGPTTIHIEASAKYTGRSDCPSVFAMQAFVSADKPDSQDASQPAILHRESTPTLEAPPGDYWERAVVDLQIEYWKNHADVQRSNSRPRFLTVVVIGKDLRFWQGRFGSKVADISVRIIGSPQDLEMILSPDASSGAPSWVSQRVDNTGAHLEPELRRRARHNDAQGNMNEDTINNQGRPVLPVDVDMSAAGRDGGELRQYTAGRLIWEVFLPVACLVLFLWLNR